MVVAMKSVPKGIQKKQGDTQKQRARLKTITYEGHIEKLPEGSVQATPFRALGI